MKKILRVGAVLFSCVFFTTLTAGSLPMTPLDIAQAYYLALYGKEFEKVRAVAAPDMVFEDPTALAESGLASQLDSLAAFLDYMAANLGEDTTVRIVKSFASNDRVVLYVEITGTASAQYFGGPAHETVEVKAEGLTVLQIHKGRVIRHTDYFDYPALNTFVAAQLR